MTVLIVEDTDLMRRRLREILVHELKIQDANIYEVPNGHEAVKQYKAVNPDYVFLDIFMPGMNGIRTMAKLKAMDPDVYAIMITASATRQVVIEAILAGAKDYIKKPPTLEKIARSLNINLFNPQPQPRERHQGVTGVSKALITEVMADTAFDLDVLAGLTFQKGGDDLLNELLND